MRVSFLIASVITLFLFNSGFAQSINGEQVSFQVLKEPKVKVEEANRKFKVAVTSPYNLTSDDIISKSKSDFQEELKNFDKTLAKSEAEYQQKLKDHDAEVAAANAKYELESTEFKKLSMLERLTMTDQGKNPKLVTPTKPQYYPPSKPIYREPNLNDYIIVNNNVLATQININGFSREGNYLDVFLDIQKINFQDNNGQTYANQPTKLIVKVNGLEKANTTFYQEYKMVSSSPSNNINKPLTEKNFLNEVIATVNKYLNENFGYQSLNKSVTLLSVKNKNGKYDDLEKANIYITTNLNKLNPQNPEMSTAAISGMQKGIDIWISTLQKIDYKDKKSDFNAKIAEMVYFNLIRLNSAMDNKKEAEKWLNEMQENMIYMDLSYDDKNALKNIETEIYKK
ncbi:hypothetical protein ABGT15_06910 [Flavobacterium enshiense]|uniref:hypothetical protein n=1 Tax=Flavobacterium enshiense TaxID=1341165 RepID=UPI00345DBC53